MFEKVYVEASLQLRKKMHENWIFMGAILF